MHALGAVRDAIDELVAVIADARDLLGRQACNCMDTAGRPATGRRVKVRCLRCELLDVLGPASS